jgi:ATP-dependent Lon protease
MMPEFMSRLLDLPLFPLGLVLYPTERLPLHIFEPRFQEMTQECLRNDRPFGVILYEEGKMADVGCTAQIVEVVKRYDDGRMDIIVEGNERFRVNEVRQERAFLTVDAETLDEPGAATQQTSVERLITQHMKLLELAGQDLRPNLYRDVPHVSYMIAHNAGLSVEQKQELLELPTEDERVRFLVGHLEAIIPKVEKANTIRRKIQSNGHFQDFPPETS